MSVSMVPTAKGTSAPRLSNVFSPRPPCTPERGIPSFVITAPSETGSLSFHSPSPASSFGFQPLSLGQAGFSPFSIDLDAYAGLAEDASSDGDGTQRSADRLLVEGTEKVEQAMIDTFPLPPSHIPAPTPPRRFARSVSAASTPSSCSADSSSSDEMPITPRSDDGESWRWMDADEADEDDDARTITGVMMNEARGWSSRRGVSYDFADWRLG